jgi:hypothetical protein
MFKPIVNFMLFSLQTAIKKMKKKYYSWEECMQLREVKVRYIYID